MLPVLKQYVYLIHPDKGENVFKIGKTTQDPPYKRFSQYSKNITLECLTCVNDCHILEKQLIKLFKAKFIYRKDLGYEYFEGDKQTMIKIIRQMVDAQLPDYVADEMDNMQLNDGLDIKIKSEIDAKSENQPEIKCKDEIETKSENRPEIKYKDEPKKTRNRESQQDYECYRCGYNTNNRGMMDRHLFKKATICPGTINDIIFTDEIKLQIMTNRIYKPQPKQDTILKFKTYANNYNILNNHINNLDIFEKLNKYVNYKGDHLINFEDKVKSAHFIIIKKLDDNYMNFEDQLFDIVNNITKSIQINMQDFNLVYNKKMDTLNVYRNKAWTEVLVDIGIKELMCIIKLNYLDNYEQQLINENNSHDANNNRILLDEYYKFIAFFDLPPHADNIYLEIYKNIKSKIKRSEQNSARLKVANIVKQNTIANISKLNKNIIDLINIDEEFRKTMTDKIKFHTV